MRANRTEADCILTFQDPYVFGAHGDRFVVEDKIDNFIQRGFQCLTALQKVTAEIIVNISPGTADGHHRIIDAVAAQSLQQIHNKFTLIPDMHKQRIMADDMAGDAHPKHVRMQTFQLSRNHTDVLTALWNFRLINGFHTHGIGKSMGMRADSADTLHKDKRLDGIAFGGKLFDPAVVVSDEYFRVFDHFTLGVECCMNRLFQSRMIRAYRNNIAHFLSSFSVPFSLRSSESGLTMIWPLPSSSSRSYGKNRRLETSSPSNVQPKSSLSSLSGHSAATS